MNDGARLTPAEHDSAMAAVAKAPALMRPLMTRMIDDPEGMKQGLRRLVPRMFFALLPLYAGILALFYRRRHYPEHLYFAIHLHAFVFVALMFTELVKFTYQVKLAAAAGIAAFVWIAAYSLSALKKVYGGGWAGTIAKGFGIMTLYFLIAMPVMLVTIYLASVLT